MFQNRKASSRPITCPSKCTYKALMFFDVLKSLMASAPGRVTQPWERRTTARARMRLIRSQSTLGVDVLLCFSLFLLSFSLPACFFFYCFLFLFLCDSEVFSARNKVSGRSTVKSHVRGSMWRCHIIEQRALRVRRTRSKFQKIAAFSIIRT